MFFVNPTFYLIGICIGLMIFFIIMFVNSVKRIKADKTRSEAINKFEAMAKGKTYDEIVAILKKPQEEIDKVCPDTGVNIKVAKWKGGYYYWEQYRYDIVVVFLKTEHSTMLKCTNNLACQIVQAAPCLIALYQIVQYMPKHGIPHRGIPCFYAGNKIFYRASYQATAIF